MISANELLWEGIQQNNLKKMERALQKGANPEKPDVFGFLPISKTRSPAAAGLLLKNGADMNKGHTVFKDTPLMLAQNDEMALYFIRIGICVHSIGSQGEISLHKWVNHPHVVEALISKKINVNARDYWNRTPLMLVENAESAKLLLKAGANVNAADKHGLTPLMCASSDDIFKILLQASPLLDQQDNTGKTAAMHHIRFVKRLELLSNAGANLHQTDKQNCSLLHYAIPYPETVDFLLKKGLDPNLKNIFGEKPTDYIPNEKVIKLFEKAKKKNMPLKPGTLQSFIKRKLFSR